MQRIIDHDYEIMRTETPTEEAIKLFNRQGLKDKELLLSTRGKMLPPFIPLTALVTISTGRWPLPPDA